jgi:hypothetical protein
MNTDRLIDLLSVDPQPVETGQLGKLLLMAMVTGGAVAVLLMLATVGARPDLQSTSHLEWLAVKLLFALSVIVSALPLLNGSIRPGSKNERYRRLVFLPFLVAIALALAMLLFSQPLAREPMLRGATKLSSARCLISIMFFAAVPLASVFWAVRKGASTRLKLSGGVAGLVAGAIGAAAYAFSCTSDTLPFVALWYGMAIALCAAIGAQLGPRILRW